MTRIGWLLLIVFAIIVAVFALMVRIAPPVPEMKMIPAPQAAPTIIGPGGLAIPVQGVPPSAIADNFDQARGGGTRAHGALDIPAPRGTIVMAAAPGIVEKLFESDDGGHTIYIRSDDGGWVYYYAHLDAVLPMIAEGAHVDRAQAIGTVGSTGNADPAAPHLHFEVKRMAPGDQWHQGQGVDPYPLLVAANKRHLAAGARAE